MSQIEPLLQRLRSAHDGQHTGTYQPSLIQFVPRAMLRAGDVPDPLPFRGEDVLVCYELSWINSRGKPDTAVVELHVPCRSANVIESGSLQRYLASFAQTEFLSRQDVMQTLELDIGGATRSPVMVNLLPDDMLLQRGLSRLAGTSLDTLDLDIRHYERQPKFLTIESEVRHKETVFSHLLRCLCPVTGRPNIGSITLRYVGRPLDHRGLIRYVISLRNQPLFREQLTEAVFTDVMAQCEPEQLTVECRFLRCSGIETNCVRSTQTDQLDPLRLARQ